MVLRMGYSLSGYAEFVVADESADFGRFAGSLHDDPMAMNLTLLPTVSGYTPPGAMVEGITANSHYVRFAGPVVMLDTVLAWLRELCSECFPRQH
jgi:hypothetical protein